LETQCIVSFQPRSCVFPIALYGFQLWFYNKALLSYPLRELNKMQRRAAIWILKAFHTSPLFSIKAITGLILIYLCLWKLSSRSQLRAHSLPFNHILKLLLELRQVNKYKTHQLSLKRLTPKQCLNIKGPVVDMNNKINEIFSLFDLFNKEFSPRDRLIDVFPNHFSFYSTNRQSEESIKMHIHNLNNIILWASADLKSAIAVSNASIKNQIAISILHIHVYNRPIIKTVHYAINDMFTEAKIFAIGYSIN